MKINSSLEVTGTVEANSFVKKNGTSVQFLKADGSVDATSYLPTTLTSAKGDIIYASAANTPVRLPIGSEGQVLKVSGGVPVWGTDTNSNQTVKVGNTTFGANAVVGFIAGNNVDSIVADTTNNTITINTHDTTYTTATTSAAGLMSAADKLKLDGIAAGAEVNVQSDWNVTDSSSDAFIKNKPSIPTVYLKNASVNGNTLTITKQDNTTVTYNPITEIMTAFDEDVMEAFFDDNYPSFIKLVDDGHGNPRFAFDTASYLPLSGGTSPVHFNSSNLPQFSGSIPYFVGIEAFGENGGTLKWQSASNVSVGYASSAGNADTVDNEHASAFVHKAGDIMSSYLGARYSNRAFYSFVNGGLYNNSASDVTGMILIKLPSTDTHNTMLKFTVSIYNYANQTSCDYIIGGYPYQDGNWYSTSAYCVGKGGRANLKVRFFKKDANEGWRIGIGESNTTWYYPQITIKDVEIGFSDAYTKTWQTDWSISIITTPPAESEVHSSIDNTGFLSINGKAADADLLDGHDSSYFATSAHTHTAANIISWLGLGTIRSASAMTWGTLTTANGYTILLATDQPNGGGWVIAEKDGKTYMQIDGDFYVNEGGTRLARVGEAQPANGGNSDTVDGEHAYAFAHNGTANNLIMAGNEFNFIPGSYAPETVWFNYRTTTGYDATGITTYNLGDGKGGLVGTIIHSGNIGSQSVNYANSAGNADTLDNHDSSYFYPASNPNSYTSVTETTVTNWGFTKNAGTVIGSGLTADYIVLGNGTVNVKISSYKPASSSVTWGETNNTYLPTMAAVSSYVLGKGYGNNQKVKAGSVTFDANDVVNFEGSGIITVTGDATNDKITISASHQSIKSLDTTATAAQSTNSNEAIAGSGKITLHKVSKTGSYSDLNDKPTIPATNVIPAIAGAGHVLLSTEAAGTAYWSNWSTPGVLMTNNQGIVSPCTQIQLDNWNTLYISSLNIGVPGTVGTSFIEREIPSGQLPKNATFYLPYDGGTLATQAWVESKGYTTDSVSGANDGTNWTSITINGVTKAIPSGGSGSLTLDNVSDGTTRKLNQVTAATGKAKLGVKTVGVKPNITGEGYLELSDSSVAHGTTTYYRDSINYGGKIINLPTSAGTLALTSNIKHLYKHWVIFNVYSDISFKFEFYSTSTTSSSTLTAANLLQMLQGKIVGAVNNNSGSSVMLSVHQAIQANTYQGFIYYVGGSYVEFYPFAVNVTYVTIEDSGYEEV